MQTITSTEHTAFQLILHSGNARSYLMEAMRMSRENLFQEAEEKLIEAKKELNQAHHAQTELIQAEARGDQLELSILLIHAQDHLMNAITVRDLTEEVIHLHKRISNKC